eukprot:g34195.t1
MCSGHSQLHAKMHGIIFDVARTICDSIGQAPASPASGHSLLTCATVVGLGVASLAALAESEHRKELRSQDATLGF